MLYKASSDAAELDATSDQGEHRLLNARQNAIKNENIHQKTLKLEMDSSH